MVFFFFFFGMFTFQNKYSAAKTRVSVPSIYRLQNLNFLPKYPKLLRYTLRANPLKSSISPLSTTPKITTYHPKILSNPYKLRLQSNSDKNHTHSIKFHLTNHQKSNIKITQNTSKINTFQPYQTHKQHYSIEVIFFTIKFTSKLTSKK